MAIGKPPWKLTFQSIDREVTELAKPYGGRVSMAWTQYGFVTFSLTLAYGRTEVKRDVGPFDMNAEDWRAQEKKIAVGLVEAINDAKLELMDPTGELKTIGVRKVYESING